MLKIDISKSIQSESGKTDLLFKANINSGSIVGVFGNSGQGKSTLLNIISGIVKPDSGTINFNDTTWVDQNNNLFVSVAPSIQSSNFSLQNLEEISEYVETQKRILNVE